MKYTGVDRRAVTVQDGNETAHRRSLFTLADWTGVSLLAPPRRLSKVLCGTAGSGVVAFLQFNEAFFEQFFEKFDKVALTTGWLHVVLAQHGLVQFDDATRRLEQVPHLRAHGVQAIVDPIFHVQNGCFAAHVTGNLLLGSDNDRLPGQFLSHPSVFSDTVRGSWVRQRTA